MLIRDRQSLVRYLRGPTVSLWDVYILWVFSYTHYSIQTTNVFGSCVPFLDSADNIVTIRNVNRRTYVDHKYTAAVHRLVRLDWKYKLSLENVLVIWTKTGSWLCLNNIFYTESWIMLTIFKMPYIFITVYQLRNLKDFLRCYYIIS